jgi:hypothetical protein
LYIRLDYGRYTQSKTIAAIGFVVIKAVYCKDTRGAHRVLVGKPEGKRPMGRPRRRWEDNIKMDLQKVGGSRRDWMELAQDRDRCRTLVGTVRDFSGSINAGNFLTSGKV